MVEHKYTEEQNIAFLFIIIPALMLFIGYFINPYPASDSLLTSLLQIPLFLGLILLLIGFILRNSSYSGWLKISGWIVFGFYWATQPAHLYFGEGNDIFNAVLCILGVFVLFYIAYHEWLSIKRNENISCLNWIAGASALAGIIYFGIERIAIAPWNINIKEWLIEHVTEESTWLLDKIIGNATVNGANISLDGTYVVTIIFACTAIQAMVIFVGMIGALPKISIKRRAIGLIITVLPVFILNLFRNAMVAFLVGKDITDFFWAHNVLSKVGALISLIVLLLITIKIIPEILDEIFCLIDLHKREGPIERMIIRILGKKNEKE